jgi:hypothetical protein
MEGSWNLTRGAYTFRWLKIEAVRRSMGNTASRCARPTHGCWQSWQVVTHVRWLVRALSSVAERPGFCRLPRSAGPALCIIARCMHYIISRIPIYAGSIRRQNSRSTALLLLSTGFLGCDKSRELTVELIVLHHNALYIY